MPAVAHEHGLVTGAAQVPFERGTAVRADEDHWLVRYRAATSRRCISWIWRPPLSAVIMVGVKTPGTLADAAITERNRSSDPGAPLARTQQEGGKFFDALVEEGVRIQEKNPRLHAGTNEAGARPGNAMGRARRQGPANHLRSS